MAARKIIKNVSPFADFAEALCSFFENTVWTANAAMDDRRPLPHFMRSTIKALNLPGPSFAIILLIEALIYLVSAIINTFQTFFNKSKKRKLIESIPELIKAVCYVILLGGIAAFLIFNFPQLLNIAYLILSSVDILVNLTVIGYLIHQLFFNQNLSEDDRSSFKTIIKNSIIELVKGFSYLGLTLLGTFIAPAYLPTQLIMMAISLHDNYLLLKPHFIKFYQWLAKKFERGDTTLSNSNSPSPIISLNLNDDIEPAISQKLSYFAKITLWLSKKSGEVKISNNDEILNNKTNIIKDSFLITFKNNLLLLFKNSFGTNKKIRDDLSFLTSGSEADSESDLRTVGAIN